MRFSLTTLFVFFAIAVVLPIRSMEMNDYKKPLLEDCRLEEGLLQLEGHAQVPALDQKFIENVYTALSKEGRKALSNVLSSQPELKSFIMQNKIPRKNRDLGEVLMHARADKDFVDVVSALHNFCPNVLLTPRYAAAWREIMDYLPNKDRNMRVFKDYIIRHITPGAVTAKKEITNFNGRLIRVPEEKVLKGVNRFYKTVKYGSSDDNILRRPYKDFSSLQDAIWDYDSKAFRIALEEYIKNFNFIESLYTSTEVTHKKLLYMAAIEILNCLKCTVEGLIGPYLNKEIGWYIILWETLKELCIRIREIWHIMGFI